MSVGHLSEAMDESKIIDYFGGRLSPEEEASVQRWLAVHGDSPEVSRILESLYESSADHDKEALDSAFKTVGRKTRGTGRRLRAQRVLSAAAAVAIAVSLPLVYLAGRSHGKDEISSIAWVEKQVPTGESSTLTLSDGTVLHLNSGSRVTYPESFSGEERNIFVDGEVFAEVAKDAEHPFIINSGDTRVMVLGTTFNFKSFSTGSYVELLLLEGSVRVSVDAPQGPRDVVMSPGNMMQYDRGTGDVEVSNFSTETYKTFYEDGSLHFFNLRMQDIADDLTRHFGTKVVVTDEALARSRYFAIFTNNESLDEILASLNLGGRMTIEHRDGAVYLKTNNR